MKFSKYPKLYWRMIRYRTSLTFALFILLGALWHSKILEINPPLIFSILALVTMYACATCVNDLMDWKIDQVNLQGHNDRPLVTGEGGRKDLYFLAAVLGLASLLLAFSVNLQVGILILIVLIINLAYSLPPLKISHKPLLTPFFLAASYTVIPYAMGVASVGQTIGAVDKFFLPAIFFLFLARINLKDFRDREGDLKNKKPTMVLVYGKNIVCAISIFSILIGVVFLFLAFQPHNWLVIGLSFYILEILFALSQLAKNKSKEKELISIGVAARLSTGMFLNILGFLILQANNSGVAAQIVLYFTITILYSFLFLDFFLHPEQFSLGFKNNGIS
jgi:4-hydroxybenzoate polyprenyltransferase